MGGVGVEIQMARFKLFSVEGIIIKVSAPKLSEYVRAEYVHTTVTLFYILVFLLEYCNCVRRSSEKAVFSAFLRVQC